MTGTAEAVQELGKIEAFVEQQNRENETRTQELQQRQQQLQEQRRALNPQTLGEMQREISNLEKNLKRYREDTAEEIEARRNLVFANLGQKLQGILDETAKQNGYAAILYWDSLMQNNLGGYFDPAYDITEDIIAPVQRQVPRGCSGHRFGTVRGARSVGARGVRAGEALEERPGGFKRPLLQGLSHSQSLLAATLKNVGRRLGAANRGL